MNENETLVTEEVAEKVETATEEIPERTYTQKEVDDIVGKRLARQEARFKRIKEKEDREKDDLIETLRAGTGKQTVGELNGAFTKFYEEKGIKINKKPEYTDRDVEILAKAEANDIIGAGYEEVVDEVDRLAKIGIDKMTAREKAVFKHLAEHRQEAERGMELTKLGVTEDVYGSKDFKDFASKFNKTTPIRDIYDIYNKTHPKKEFKTAGSMKNTASADDGLKDFYTPEEARKFTKADFDKNPQLLKRVEESSYKWR